MSLSPVGGEATARSSSAVTAVASKGRATTTPLSRDPRQDMSAPAVKILAAAQRVLVAKGFAGLTLRAIARESGENSAMVQYYFGNKEGLVRAMIDSVFRDDQDAAAAVMSTVTSADRLPRFVDGLRTISSSRSFRVFFDVLPYALRNEGLRSRMARAYDWYRQIKLDWLRARDQASPSEQPALLGLAELMTAVVDGLAIQEAIDDGFDMRRPYAVLEFMLRRSLPDLLDAGALGGPSSK
ncbi:MAG: TetR/AcrR family transcriptional regulator [Actinobacteria bacterium]|nr:TetR/AcrR family transcriptional regulator [Actinomycetota bacterium]